MTAFRAASLAVWLPFLLPLLAAAQAADAPLDADAVLEELAKVTQMQDAGSIRALMARARKAAVAPEALRPAVEHLQSLELESMPEEMRFDKVSEEYGRDHCQKKSVVVAAECRLDDEQLVRRSQIVGEENCNHYSLREGADPTSSMAFMTERSKLFCKFPLEFDIDRMSGGLGAPREFEWSVEFEKILNKSGASESAVLNLNLPMYKAVIEPCEHTDIWLIVFYQHWCPHCQAFAPKLYKFALAARDAGARLRFAAVNCGDARTMCDYFQVRVHPMIGFVYKGSDIRVQAILQTFEHNPPTEMVEFMREHHKIDIAKWLFPHSFAGALIKQLPDEYRPPLHLIEHISVDDDSAMFSDKPKSSCPTVRLDQVHLASIGRELPKQEDARKLALTLTPKTFGATLKEKGNLAILFTGDDANCKTCPLALPVWNSAKRKLDGISFAVIDGLLDEKFTKRFFKRGEVILPSILYFNYAKCRLQKCKEYMGPLYAGAAPEKQFYDWLVTFAGAKAKTTEELDELGFFIGNGWQLLEFGFTAMHRFHEAAQAIVYMLDEWVVPDVSSQSPNGFTLSQLNDIHAWVSLLVTTFPSVGNFSLSGPLRILRDTLAKRVQDVRAAQGKLSMCAEEWRELMVPLREHFIISRENQTLKPSCFTETCRVWTLLHIITISDLAQNRTVSSAGGNKIVFETITAFLKRFFTCATCRGHFLDAVTLGSFNLAHAMSGGPRELALWWWRMHNDVSQRIKHEGRCRGDRQWPPIDLCQDCWQDTTGQRVIDEDAIARELVRQYWPSDAAVSEAQRI